MQVRTSQGIGSDTLRKIRKEATVMKRYFVDGNEISEAQAILIENENNKLINSGNIASLIGCKFITIINN